MTNYDGSNVYDKSSDVYINECIVIYRDSRRSALFYVSRHGHLAKDDSQAPADVFKSIPCTDLRNK